MHLREFRLPERLRLEWTSGCHLVHFPNSSYDKEHLAHPKFQHEGGTKSLSPHGMVEPLGTYSTEPEMTKEAFWVDSKAPTLKFCTFSWGLHSIHLGIKIFPSAIKSSFNRQPHCSFCMLPWFLCIYR